MRTVRHLAIALQVGERTCHTWLTEGAPGEKGRYSVSAFVEWARENKWSAADVDPLLGGPDSPALERFRAARANLAELELQERQRTFIPIDELLPTLLDGAGVIRQAGEALGREYGAEAQRVINDAVSEFVAGLDQLGEGSSASA